MYPDKNKKLNIRPNGMTLVELVTTLLIAAITVLAIGFFLSDSHRSFNETYRKGLSDAAQDEMVIRTAFCKVIRTASTTTAGSVDSDGEWLEVPIYSTPGLSSPDQYALFYVSENQLLLEKGDIETRQTQSTEVLSDNFNSVNFSLNGTSASMLLDIDDNGSSSRRLSISAAMRSP